MDRLVEKLVGDVAEITKDGTKIKFTDGRWVDLTEVLGTDVDPDFQYQVGKRLKVLGVIGYASNVDLADHIASILRNNWGEGLRLRSRKLSEAE